MSEPCTFCPVSPWVLPAGQGPSPSQTRRTGTCLHEGWVPPQKHSARPRATTHREPIWAGRVEINRHVGKTKGRVGHGQLLLPRSPGSYPWCELIVTQSKFVHKVLRAFFESPPGNLKLSHPKPHIQTLEYPQFRGALVVPCPDHPGALVIP